MAELKGLIYNIEKFAIHDGPGIRTLVFMKGCPIRCLWCSSPQSQRTSFELLHDELCCQKCGSCVKACPANAITLSPGGKWEISREFCTYCGECVAVCPGGALEMVGKYWTVDELYVEIDKDRPFYTRTGGGVTVGGGEPTMQYEFVADFLKKCKQHYIHTAMETCGYAIWEHLELLLQSLNLVFFDVKNMDAAKHQDLTGVGNELILENARRAAALRPIIIRIPTIPGHNDSEENILATARFAAGLGDNLIRIELLPYHRFGTDMYRRLGHTYELENVELPRTEHMQRLKEIVESCGVKAQIGG